ncbi:F-box domain protein [Aspergillus nomiae NRRL 13137]|uniref:F-box domain protein n=1 Tax=Aspergillus nomiae NRRL (strain ATCC 15546 / NRRL 13137 / CBS 260.88 / M93) TaxID=1509407 RepID=A0A0L1IUM2_ASPN3|nr:F-box domain protein [Aspergillus nomiae NRRL 13137]KNG83197.1 F-box domain protein [Aspergillus nomiae NRRL 13137]
MPHLFHLPLELLAQVISYVDQSTLKCLRRTCRTLAQLASPELFRVVRLFPNEQNYERLRNISRDATLETLVFWGYKCILTETVKYAVMQLKRFPNVQSTVLRVQSLRLNIVTERLVELVESPADEIQYHEAHEFFEEMSSNWLNPTMGSLEHLTLHCDQKWSFFPKVYFHGIRFPRLKTLALGNFAFGLNSQVEWILSHALTLTELYLDDCIILYDFGITQEGEWRCPGCPEPSDYYRSGEKLWNDLFDALRTGLPLLQHFRMGSTCWSYSDGELPFEKETTINIGLLHDRYMGCHASDPDDYMPKVNEKAAQENGEIDRAALRLLLESIGQHVPPSWSVGRRNIRNLVDTKERR